MDLLIGLVVIVAILALWTWHWHRMPPNFPPMKIGLPIVGSMPFITLPGHECLTAFGKPYGDMYSFKLGRFTFVMCNTWKAVKAVFLEKGENHILRPKMPISEDVMHGNDIATIGGPTWRERKRFCLYHFKNFGFGKAPMEGYIMEDTVALIEKLKANGPKKIDVTYLFFFPLLNIIWRLVGGKRFQEDSRIKEFISDIITLFENGAPNNIFIFIPYTIYLPIIRRKYLKLKAAHKKVSAFIEVEVDDHIKNYKDGQCHDLIDAFIAEMRKDDTKERAEKFKKEVIIGLAYDFFNAAVDAGNHTLSWAMLYMATWRDIQQKVHEELDRVVGRDRLPAYPDKPSLVYTEAVVMEIMRYSSVAPLSVPHAAIAPTKVLGFDLPKGTIVVENIWAVHFDPKLWGDPEVFRPERFITEKGEIHRPEYFIPFGIGARMCMGPPLGRVEMFLIFAGLMHQFNVSYVTGEKPPTFNAVIGLNSRPENFGLSFTPR